jgi:hypothetical protein
MTIAKLFVALQESANHLPEIELHHNSLSVSARVLHAVI